MQSPSKDSIPQFYSDFLHIQLLSFHLMPTALPLHALFQTKLQLRWLLFLSTVPFRWHFGWIRALRFYELCALNRLISATRDQWRSQTFPDGRAHYFYKILSIIYKHIACWFIRAFIKRCCLYENAY